ncbi:MAG: thioesterase family protein [Bacteroidales bacterium]|jgi:acyl-CoA thioester hydrolase|nr:acyl-CoA thioesterase [Bacteroidales bacterium]MDD2263539.1 thioesterase family protein [Bacteroidales bacterium]MDD2830670.1 thioesterase family protein [Bacteroidales bacterium]MDD3207869.1 thioesterase family protein [Bacteroidales bacterium]MDD3696623.1 thioesterase family protein [Bacteroidales bacterium]
MHKTPIQIRFNDIDMLGHVNNVMFGHYCDVARTDFFLNNTSYCPDFFKDDKVLILVHTEYDYMMPCFLTDTLFVQTSIKKNGERSLHFLQEVVDDKGTVRVRSRSIMSTFDKSTGKSFPLPREWFL